MKQRLSAHDRMESDVQSEKRKFDNSKRLWNGRGWTLNYK
tara:strand:+ start:119 stop:238 length:120 start_codon:yes stop_codon:yes gene_type:complete